MSAREKGLEAGRARRQRLGQEPVERPSTAGRRYSEADIDMEAGGKRGKPPGTHATDLRNFLRMHYGYSFDVRENILEGQSNNMRALRVACLARRDPLAAARMVNTWLGAELNAGVVRGKQMYLGEDEFNPNNYLSWTCGGHLGTLKELEGASGSFTLSERDEIEGAIRNLRRWLGMTQALLAVLAVPGRIRNLQGRTSYEGPVVFAAGLRSIKRREGNNARTQVASALLGGGRYVGDPGPLATAIQELSDELLDQGMEKRLESLWLPVATLAGHAWPHAVELAKSALAGIRTAMHFQARVYADGTKVSMLLGPKGPSSTQEVRLVAVRGPEITDATVVTPHAEGDERTVPPSDGRILDGEFVTGISRDGRSVGAVSYELPEGDPVLQLDTYPDRAEEWTVRA